MHDPDTRGFVLLIALFVLTVVIGVLGVSVLIRAARDDTRETPSPGGTALLTLALLVVAFVSVGVPFFAVFPGLLFLVQSVRTWNAGKGLPREAGAVMLLAALGWVLCFFYQLAMLDWSRTVSAPIRIDILLVIPMMGAISCLGWWVGLRSRA